MSRKPSVPSLGRHAATGQARVLINGRHVYLGRYGSPGAEEKYRRVVAELLAGKPASGPNASASSPADGSMTVNELVLAYWRHAERYYRKNGKPSSELSTFKTPLRVLRRLYGSTPAAEFGPLKLKAVREELIRDGRDRAAADDGDRHLRGQCRSTANRSIGRIRRMFSWAVENELVPASVSHGLKAVVGLRKGRTPAREKGPVLPVREADIDAALPHVSGRVRDMIRLQLLSGCRPGEVLALRPCDVNRSGDVWEHAPVGHKTEHHGRGRRVFFGPAAQAILAAYLDNRPAEEFCFSPAEAEWERLGEACGGRGTSCIETDGSRSQRRGRRKRAPGGRYTIAAYRRAIERACRRAGVPIWSPNRLRHSRATDLRRRFGLEAAQTVLGHAELEVTQVYAERDFAAARKIMAEVG